MYFYKYTTLLFILKTILCVSSENIDFYEFLSKTDIGYFQPFHINVVSDTLECLDSVTSNIRFSVPYIPIMLIMTQSFRSKLSFSANSSFFAHKKRKWQHSSTLFPKIKSNVVILSVSSISDILIEKLENQLFWTSRAQFVISLCGNKRYEQETPFSAKEILKRFDEKDLCSAISIKGSGYLLYKPLPSRQFVRNHFSPQLKWTDLFPEKFQNLNGKMLRAGTFHHPPAAVRKDNNEWEGVEIRLLKVLAKKLNFTFEVVPPANNEKWGYQIAGTEKWVGLFGQIIERTVDVAFANMFLFEERLLLSDFSSLYDDDKACFGVPNRIEIKVDWIGPFKPFSLPVWIIISTLPLVVIFVFKIRKWTSNQDNLLSYLAKTRDKIRLEKYDCIDSLGTCLGKTSVVLPKQFSIRVMSYCWSISGLFIMTLYQGFLISKMTIPVVDLPIDTLHDLDKSELTVGGYIGFRALLQLPTKLLPLYDKYTSDGDFLTLLNRIAHSKDFALLENARWFRYFIEEKYTDSYGNKLIHIVKECCGHFNVGFIFPIGSKYFPIMNGYIQRIFESGLISKWHDDLLMDVKSSHQKNFTNYMESIGTGKATVLTLRHLQASFYVLACGCGIALFARILEWRWEKYRSNKVKFML